jgi:cell division protein FtsI (penicillin-binding protein 3)/stage V sporulation protein D (sporulation-specific penicillin-binding protein)
MRHVFRFRLRILFLVLLIPVALLVIRLYFVQIVHGQDYALQAQHQYVNTSQELYDRGSIYFTRKDGTLISAATLATGFLVAIDPEKVSDPEATYAALSSVITLDKADFMKHAEKKNDPYEEIADRVSEADGEAISNKNLAGVSVIRERWRLYPAGTDAAQTIGFVAYNDDNQIAGRYGLERYYESTLARSGGGLFGNFFAQLFADIGNAVVDARSAKEGDVVTSIEPVVEQKLSETVASINARYSSQETGGIIMDPKTGTIIALQTAPTFDPNQFSDSNVANFGNHLIERRYEFGSVVKSLTMTAGIDAGVITPDSTYYDTGCITVDTKPICDHDSIPTSVHPHGTTGMQEVLSQSLNLGAAFVANKVGHAGIKKYFTELGMGTETGIDLPSEISGTLAGLDTDRDVNYDTASFGQGIAMTPVGMIRALGALANGGSVVTPHLATAIRLESGVTRTLSWGAPEPVFQASSVETVTKMLVTAMDTALLSGKAKIPEMSVAAKTGTAQIASPAGGYYADRYFHSFFGYFPAYDPKFIILLYTVDPKGVSFASETLTSSFADLVKFLTNYYSIPPDRADYKTTP